MSGARGTGSAKTPVGFGASTPTEPREGDGFGRLLRVGAGRPEPPSARTSYPTDAGCNGPIGKPPVLDAPGGTVVVVLFGGRVGNPRSLTL